jgi:hypothetical protein
MFSFFIFINQNVAQEITATLSGHATDDGFSVKDDLGNTLLRVRGDANIGIGTTSPNNPFQVNNVIVGGFRGEAGSGYAYQVISATYHAGLNDYGVGYGFGYFTGDMPNVHGLNQFAQIMGIPQTVGTENYRGHLSFWTRNASSLAERVRITEDGNFGIGTTTPTAKLDVNGSTGYNQLRIRSSFTPTGTNDASGNVGDIAWDDSYIYVKTNSGWKRSTLSTWP